MYYRVQSSVMYNCIRNHMFSRILSCWNSTHSLRKTAYSTWDMTAGNHGCCIYQNSYPVWDGESKMPSRCISQRELATVTVKFKYVFSEHCFKYLFTVFLHLSLFLCLLWSLHSLLFAEQLCPNLIIKRIMVERIIIRLCTYTVEGDMGGSVHRNTAKKLTNTASPQEKSTKQRHRNTYFECNDSFIYT